MDQLEKPGGVSSIEWVTQVHGLRVSSYYALGRSQLESWRLSLSPEQLQEAIEHFNRTLELDPEHGYAAFRLGFAQLKARDPEAALEAYARATVLDGPAAEPSRSHLEKILTETRLLRDPYLHHCLSRFDVLGLTAGRDLQSLERLAPLFGPG